MQHFYTTARPYAKAAFEEAVQNGQLQLWAELLQSLALIAQDDEVQSMLINPNVSSEALIDMFTAGAKQFADHAFTTLGEKVTNFLTLLRKNKRLALLPDIAELYLRMYAEQQGVVQVQVYSATALDDSQRAELETSLSKRFNSDVKPTYSIDETLIGGALIRAGNWVMDGSIRGKLNRLNEHLA